MYGFRVCVNLSFNYQGRSPGKGDHMETLLGVLIFICVVGLLRFALIEWFWRENGLRNKKGG